MYPTADASPPSPLPHRSGRSRTCRVGLTWLLVVPIGGDRLDPESYDEIELAWSPDGTRLAMHTEQGLALLELDGRTMPLLDRGGHGGIDLAR